MEKVLILGRSGSGKSTLAVRLHQVTGLPLYHLDNIWWRPDRTHISREEFDQKLDELICRDSWIIDGDYSRTYEKRIAACDTIIFLDYSEEVCMKGITDRVGKKRGDIPWVEDTLDPELVAMVREYETTKKPILAALFAKYSEKNIIVFHSREEAEQFIKEIEYIIWNRLLSSQKNE